MSHWLLLCSAVAVLCLLALSSPHFAILACVLFGLIGMGPAGAVSALWPLGGETTARQWIAGERFTIANITAFCALEFARGLMKFVPGDEGMPALQAWRDRMNERPSARV